MWNFNHSNLRPIFFPTNVSLPRPIIKSNNEFSSCSPTKLNQDFNIIVGKPERVENTDEINASESQERDIIYQSKILRY